MKSILAVLLVAGVAAAADHPPPIATDRPSMTDSSIVVPRGSVQFENGFAETDGRTFDGPETLIRFGVASRLELRLAVPNYFGGPNVISGFGDLAFGMK